MLLPSPLHRSAVGFSLLELLVSVTVLSILVMILAQVITLTGQAIGINTKKLDGAGQARIFFNRLAADLAARPQRADLGMTWTKAAGNDAIRFYSAVGGYSGARNVSLIGYRIQEAAPGRLFQLERGATGADWLAGGSHPLFLTQALASPNAEDYEVLSQGVLRLEFSYLLNTASPATRVSLAAASDYSDVGAVIVAIAVLDAKSRLLLSPAQLGALSRALSDSVAGEEPIATWSAQILRADFAPGVPKQAIQGLHLYQHLFNVP
ncbi:prepilin-type N-terminal cleavage/methylation domain-containing protein [Verrucomicrobium sp. GAS474]|uniref:PulJ/GspJ family protein n=1 Tax=Verrucomicrobium sp. GAS474 TaxID=1882831 RepID=UPI00087CE7D5|nr:prepilin-type N-terminal cleavage/methylation domain-containing protein [Verrucomicrobium sp. GAS474]SDT94850.1 prepilin-type N-terminal cleavage/methylation domain-containing protein [Verrucomicrobium sp. GAS474]